MVEIDDRPTGQPATAERCQRSEAAEACQSHHLCIGGTDPPHVSGNEGTRRLPVAKTMVDDLRVGGFGDGEARVEQPHHHVGVVGGLELRARPKPVVESFEPAPGVDANGHAGSDALDACLVPETSQDGGLADFEGGNDASRTIIGGRPHIAENGGDIIGTGERRIEPDQP